MPQILAGFLHADAGYTSCSCGLAYYTDTPVECCVCVCSRLYSYLSISLFLPPFLSFSSPPLAHLIAVTLRAAQLGLSFQLCLEKRLKNTLQLPPPFCIRCSQLYATVPCGLRVAGLANGGFFYQKTETLSN